MLNEMLIGTTGVLLQVQTQTEADQNASKVWGGWGSVIVIITVITIVALVISLFIWQIFRTRQTQMMSEARVAESTAYRTLAEEATAAQHRTAEELEHLRESVADLRTRVASIERMLAEVG